MRYFAFLYCYRKIDIRRGAIRAILRFCTFRKLDPIEGCYSRYFAFRLSPIEFGGVKLPHIKKQLDALKIGWLRRVISGTQTWVTLFYKANKLMQIDIFQIGLSRFHNCEEHFQNLFWYNVLYAWAITNDTNIDFNQIVRNYLWWNDKIIIGNKSVNYRHWRDKQ